MAGQSHFQNQQSSYTQSSRFQISSSLDSRNHHMWYIWGGPGIRHTQWGHSHGIHSGACRNGNKSRITWQHTQHPHKYTRILKSDIAQTTRRTKIGHGWANPFSKTTSIIYLIGINISNFSKYGFPPPSDPRQGRLPIGRGGGECRVGWGDPYLILYRMLIKSYVT